MSDQQNAPPKCALNEKLNISIWYFVRLACFTFRIMRKILAYIVAYGRTVNLAVLGASMLFLATLIWINYHFGLNDALYQLPKLEQYAAWYLVFLLAFAFPYIVQAIPLKRRYWTSYKFLLLFLIAPVIFSWKMVAHPYFTFTATPMENNYWNQLLYWPLKLVVVSLAIIAAARIAGEKPHLYGWRTKSFDARPYLTMLAIMIPLIAAASTQADFLSMYPRMQHMAFLFTPGQPPIFKLLYQLAYGTDFITIELFFRGFLVLALCKWAGKDAILPMACFYCTIHFGKPLGECISSFFGGMILGIVIFHSKTILGGLIVHLGIAWLMELGGYLGHLLKH